jgi:hypothetical protein
MSGGFDLDFPQKPLFSNIESIFQAQSCRLVHFATWDPGGAPRLVQGRLHCHGIHGAIVLA